MSTRSSKVGGGGEGLFCNHTIGLKLLISRKMLWACYKLNLRGL